MSCGSRPIFFIQLLAACHRQGAGILREAQGCQCESALFEALSDGYPKAGMPWSPGRRTGSRCSCDLSRAYCRTGTQCGCTRLTTRLALVRSECSKVLRFCIGADAELGIGCVSIRYLKRGRGSRSIKAKCPRAFTARIASQRFTQTRDMLGKFSEPCPLDGLSRVSDRLGDSKSMTGDCANEVMDGKEDLCINFS